MNETPDRTESLFAAAVALPAQARGAYLDENCGDDQKLRARLDALLRAHDHAEHMLDRPAPGRPEPTGAYVPSEQPGAVIAGRYKLLEAIGEGGMGAVWVAEQTEPVRRKVALKLIKAGMDSRSVLARFEAERQALAVMDHPNIAKVLDGGLTEAGRPFFVMEYVKGVPITEYCDAVRLSVPQRLELFVQVCQAVQHAHQKGIIHRDLKPSNILVAPYDDKPVPKVIDFGLAKAMHQSLTERTLHTAHETVLGTPLYMSPEQAQLNNLDVDTRSDVYSLGVLLYELLTGTTPLEKQRFKEAAWDEVKRIIREEEPPRPSMRLSSAQTLPSLAAGRQIEPAQLTKLVRGELDWIVMKALEKDRARRYDTPNTLSRDIERYLADEVVEARPPSTGYRLRKFVRRHKARVVATAAFLALLVASVAVSSYLAVRAKEAQAMAEEKRQEAEANAGRAEAKAEEASRYADAYDKELERRAVAVVVAEIRSIGLQVDVDLAELRTDPKVGLLRLARPLKHTVGPFHRIGLNWEAEEVYDFGKINPVFIELREFVTAAVLAAGQEFAPLLPPITHDGHRIVIEALSPDRQTLLTLGKDYTARLWDTRTARQIAVLKKGDERVVNCGFSPDGRTIFTDDQTSVARLWDAPSGRFRAATEVRQNRNVVHDHGLVPEMLSASQIGENRLLTRRFVDLHDDGLGGRWTEWEGPVELWDTTGGQLVARLDAPDRNIQSFQFLDGKWVTALEGSTLLVFSAEDGRLLARLTDPNGDFLQPLGMGAAGRSIVTVTQKLGEKSAVLREWDMEKGQVQSSTSIPDTLRGGFHYWRDDASGGGESLVALGWEGGWMVYRTGRSEAIAAFPGGNISYDHLGHAGELVNGGNGWVFDTRTWQRLLPSPGRKFHSDLARFAPDGRFVLGAINYESVVIDTRTDKTFPVERGWNYLPGSGMIATTTSNYTDQPTTILRLPSASQLDIPADLLELWAQVAVRGELDEEGRFIKWDEPTWERKRQELAAASAPHPDVPFPGYLAKDELHWLRAEYGEVDSDADKLHLARDLLRRAESTGNKAEAVHWRAEVEQRAPKLEEPDSA